MEILLTAGGKFCLPDAGKTDYRALGKLLTVERKKSLPHCGKNTLPSTRELDARRSEMPHDRRIRKLVGYRDAGERLPGVDPSGGVFYLLGERDYDGDRTVANMRNGKGSKRHRDLGREHGQRDGRGRPAHRGPVLPLSLGHALPGPQLRRVHRGADLQLDLLRRAVGQRGLALRAPPAN